jgi:hypothetical protein
LNPDFVIGIQASADEFCLSFLNQLKLEMGCLPIDSIQSPSTSI